jgi:hypothetical protein
MTRTRRASRRAEASTPTTGRRASSPRPSALYLDTGETNWRLVHQFRQTPLPEATAASRPALEHADVRSWIGRVDLARLAYDDAQLQFQRTLDLHPRSLPAQVGMSIVLLQKDQTE